ncbi:MAG: hypothetical protein Fur002_18710 [Anaerolineales bacterium]
MNASRKLFSIFALLAIFSLIFVAPARAFDGRNGETVTIAADEVVDGDLYVNANQFTLDGVVKGDVIVFGTVIVINGTVEGDLIAAGQSVVINGNVGDDARIAGAILLVGDHASVGGDLVAAGASLEAKQGSAVEQELVAGAAQVLLAGSVKEDVLVGSGALDLRGQFGGDVNASVGDPNEKDAGGPPISMFFPGNDIPVPNVAPGLSISETARIAGDFDYTQSADIKIPSGIVGGKITRTQPVVDPAEQKVKPTPAQLALTWTFDLIRAIVTLVLLGLMLRWLAPKWMSALVDKARAKPVTALGWGVVSYAAFFFALFIILAIMIIGGMLFGALTLGGISGTIVWSGILAIFALVLTFVLATAFFAKIIVAWLGGSLLLNRFAPSMAENKFAPLILGVILLAVLMALPFIGWIFKLLAVLLGLGALWLWGAEAWQTRRAAQ